MTLRGRGCGCGVVRGFTCGGVTDRVVTRRGAVCGRACGIGTASASDACAWAAAALGVSARGDGTGSGASTLASGFAGAAGFGPRRAGLGGGKVSGV
jgi:hypothetical protein